MNTGRAELWPFENQQSESMRSRMKEINDHVDGSIKLGHLVRRAFVISALDCLCFEMSSNLDHRVLLGACLPSSIPATDKQQDSRQSRPSIQTALPALTQNGMAITALEAD